MIEKSGEEIAQHTFIDNDVSLEITFYYFLFSFSMIAMPSAINHNVCVAFVLFSLSFSFIEYIISYTSAWSRLQIDFVVCRTWNCDEIFMLNSHRLSIIIISPISKHVCMYTENEIENSIEWRMKINEKQCYFVCRYFPLICSSFICKCTAFCAIFLFFFRFFAYFFLFYLRNQSKHFNWMRCCLVISIRKSNCQSCTEYLFQCLFIILISYF